MKTKELIEYIRGKQIYWTNIYEDPKEDKAIRNAAAWNIATLEEILIPIKAGTFDED